MVEGVVVDEVGGWRWVMLGLQVDEMRVEVSDVDGLESK